MVQIRDLTEIEAFNYMVEKKLNSLKQSTFEYVWFFNGENKILSKYKNREHELLNLIKPIGIVYLSGAIPGTPDSNIPLFEKHEKQLTQQNYHVFNPHKLPNPKRKTEWVDYMIIDLPYVLMCDIVMVLPGWETSRGSKIEIFVAQQLSKKIVDHNFEEFLHHGQLKFIK